MKMMHRALNHLAPTSRSHSRVRVLQVMTIACGALLASCGSDGTATPATSQVDAASISLQGPWAARHGMDSFTYQTQFDALANSGYALRSISGYGGNGRELYAGIWEQGPSCGWQAKHGMSTAQYQHAFNVLVDQGYRLDDVSVYEGADGTERYAALWTKCAGPAWAARHGMSAAQYQATFDQMAASGYHLVNVAAASIQGRTVFAGIWEQGPGPAMQAYHGLTSEGYQQVFNQLVSQGYSPSDIAVYSENGAARYAAIFQLVPAAPWVAHHGMSSAQYQQLFNQYTQQGYRLAHVEGAIVGGQDIYAAIWSR